MLARVGGPGGRSRAWIDGRMASVGALAEAAAELIELHGQHQHRSLVHTDAQRRALDAFGHIDLAELERPPASGSGSSTEESAALGGDARHRAREVDLLRYQIDEIDGAGIEDGDEDGRLEAEEDRLAAAAAPPAGGGRGTGRAVRGPRRPAPSTGWPRPPGPWPVACPWPVSRPGSARPWPTSPTWPPSSARWSRPGRTIPSASRRSGPAGSCSTSSSASTGTTWPRSLAFADDARDRLAAIEARGAAGRGPGRRDRGGPGRAGRAEAARWPRPGGRPRPRLAAEIQATLRELAMPSARFAIAVEGDGPADQVDLPARGQPRRAAASPWPRWPPAASWPAPCWPSGWPSPTPPG